jgi:hypothetical protein
MFSKMEHGGKAGQVCVGGTGCECTLPLICWLVCINRTGGHHFCPGPDMWGWAISVQTKPLSTFELIIEIRTQTHTTR